MIKKNNNNYVSFDDDTQGDIPSLSLAGCLDGRTTGYDAPPPLSISLFPSTLPLPSTTPTSSTLPECGCVPVQTLIAFTLEQVHLKP